MITCKIFRVLVLGVCLGMVGVGSITGGTIMETAKMHVWDTQNLQELKRLFSDKLSTSMFIQELYAKRTSLVVEPTLCEYELADMKNDGGVQLAATLNDGGRFCNTVLVVENVNGKFKTHQIYGDGSITDLKSRIVDLRKDGAKQILVPRFLVSYDGANPIPVINDVYEWDGTGFRKANASFKEYYRGLLPRLQSELDAIRKGKKLDVPEYRGLLEKKYEKEIEEVNKILEE